MFLTVLDKKRRKLLGELGFLKSHGFYLAGGTALALQIGHRISLDFDFYIERQFDSRSLREEFDRRFKKVQEVFIAENTLGLSVEDISVSFFTYRYPLLQPLRDLKGVQMASVEDIAAMKIIAISQRGKKRDFLDMYFLLREMPLSHVIELTIKKYPMFNINVGLQGLVYFADADNDLESSRHRLLKKITWHEVKDFIIREVRKARLSL